MRRHPVLPAVVALATATAVAGCTKAHVDPVVNTVPTVAVSGVVPTVSAPSLPPATHKWKTKNLTCPTLTDAIATQLGVPATGKVTGDNVQKYAGDSINCQWGPDDGSATEVTLYLQTTTDPGGLDDTFKVAETAHPVRVSGVGEVAFMDTVDLPWAQSIAVRTGNATLLVKITAAKAEGTDSATMARLHDLAPDVAKDMLTALVPG